MSLITEFDVKEFNAALLTGAYQAFDTILLYPCYEATIINESDTAVYISVNGTDNSMRIGAGKTLRLTGLNRHTTIPNGEYLFAAGTQLYIKHNIGAGTGMIVLNALMAR